MLIDHCLVGADLFWRKPLPLPYELAQVLWERLALPQTWRILLADDSEVVRFVRERLLHEALGDRCEIDEACSGREALALLAKEDDYDLLLLDEHMGDAFTGTFVARAARAAGSTAVIVYSSGDSVETLSREQREAGFDLSWPKAIRAATMRRQLLECLQEGTAASAPCAPSALSAPPTATPAAPPVAPPAAPLTAPPANQSAPPTEPPVGWPSTLHPAPCTPHAAAPLVEPPVAAVDFPSTPPAASTGPLARLPLPLRWLWELLSLVYYYCLQTWLGLLYDRGDCNDPSSGVASLGVSPPTCAVGGPPDAHPSIAPTLIDHEVLSGLPRDDVVRLLAMSFDERRSASLVVMLRRLEATFYAGENTGELAHTLKGTAVSTGAREIAQHVDLFRAAPSAEGLTAIWRVLDATRCELQADGVLPSGE
jgi:CheY-like chemotaxis protein